MLPFRDARARILGLGQPLGTESVALDEARGRVLGHDVIAAAPLPGWDHSAMDGIAYGFAPGQMRWRLTGESRAGGQIPPPLEPGTAVRISTGARLPPGADTVAPRETLEWLADECVARTPVAQGKNVRRAGEDLARGRVALAAGTRVGPGASALLAALDLAEVIVARRPRVVIFSTGDELRAPGQAAGEGMIPDATTEMLRALVLAAGGEPSRLHSHDDPTATRRVLQTALAADLVITAGGASGGDHDHVKGAVAELGGEMVIDDVAIKPGKPVAVARVGAKVVAILPGNTGAAFVTFHAFAAPILRSLLGEPEPPIGNARLSARAEGAKGRTELLRCRLERRDDGLWADALPNQAPGAIVGLEITSGLAEIAGPTEAGEPVPLHRV